MTNHVQIFLVGITLLLATNANSERLHPEKYYQEKWCLEMKGESEVVLPDKTRADCITDTHAIEVDFANKWQEALGQSLWYAMQTGKKAGIMLILEQPKDNKFWIRLNTVIETYKLPIQAWKVGPAEMI